jgi:hypothetical protein
MFGTFFVLFCYMSAIGFSLNTSVDSDLNAGQNFSFLVSFWNGLWGTFEQIVYLFLKHPKENELCENFDLWVSMLSCCSTVLSCHSTVLSCH